MEDFNIYENMLTKQGLKYHHTSYAAGYVKVGIARVETYKGRYGEGFKVYTHNYNSNRYCFVSYYVKEV